MHLALDEELELLKSSVKDFAKDRLRAGSRDWDEAGEIPAEAVTEGWGLGLLLAGLPASLGGASEGDKAPSALTNAIALEELAWGDLAYAHALTTPNQLAIPVLLFGTEAEKREIVPSLLGNTPPPVTGAWIEPHRTFDLATIRTRATSSGGAWTVTGTKALVADGKRATMAIVHARTLPGEGWDGVHAFLVKNPTAGQMQRGAREEVIGPRAASLHRVTFAECEAVRLGGARGVDYRRLAERALVGSAAAAVGVARAAAEYAAGYAKERVAFGRPIAQYQSIAFKIADAFMDVEAAKWMTWKAAWKIDRGEDALAEASAAFRFATDTAWRVADDGVQIHGGHGVIRDYLAELFFRNARALAVTPGAFLV